MKNKLNWKVLSVIIVGILVLFSSVLVVKHSNEKESFKKYPIRVVTSMDFYNEVAKSVAGKYGKTTSFINNTGIDPHEYEPSTKQAKQLSTANLVIENGLGYDAWLQKMSKANGHSQTVVNVAKLMHKHEGDNEHIWYDPQTMSRLAQNLALKYGKIDPKHQKYYQERAKKYQNYMVPLKDKINIARRLVNHNKLTVYTTEPVFDYALKNLGYKIGNPKFSKAIEDDNDPSPKELAKMKNGIKHHQIAFIVDNIQSGNATTKSVVKLAQKEGVPVLKVTENNPKKQTYREWMINEYDQLIKIQRRQ